MTRPEAEALWSWRRAAAGSGKAAVSTMVLAAMFLLPALSDPPVRAPRIQCVNNLKQVALAARVWEGDNNDRYPMAVYATNGGAYEFIHHAQQSAIPLTPTPSQIGTPPYQGRVFQVMSNELSTPKVLLCPADSFHSMAATNFWTAGQGSGDFDLTKVSFFIGDDAMSERMFIKESDSKEIHDALEDRLGKDLTNLKFKGFKFAQTDDLTKPLKLDLHVSDSNYAHTAGALLLVRPRVLGSHVRTMTDVMQGKPRTYAIELGHAAHFRDSFDIAIPAGYVVDETPDPVDVNFDFASYKSSVSVKGNLLHYEREYVIKDVEISAGQASDFRKLQSAIMNDERSTAVLKKP